MIISISDHIHMVMKEIESELNSYTYPVFVNAQNNRPDLIASSVAIEINSRVFLVTASHVLDKVSQANSPFYLGLNGKFVGLEGAFTRSVHERKDHFDIAFCELLPAFVNANEIRFVVEDKLMRRRSFPSIHLSCIHGYPCTKNKQGSALKGDNRFKSFAFTYGGKIDKFFTDWAKYNKNKDFHTCMNYGRARDINGEIITPPSPRGISGGGLWLIPNSFAPKDVYLEGVFIEYHERGKISFSTKIEKVVAFIETNS